MGNFEQMGKLFDELLAAAKGSKVACTRCGNKVAYKDTKQVRNTKTGATTRFCVVCVVAIQAKSKP